MNTQSLERILHFLAGVGWVMGLVWIGLCVFTVGLLILMYTRWGQSHPLEKCMALSILAHVLLVGYATTISLATPVPPPEEPVYQVAVMEGDIPKNASVDPTVSTSTGEPSAKTEQSWEALPHEVVAQPEPVELERSHTDLPAPERVVHTEVAKLPVDPALEKTAIPKVVVPEPSSMTSDEPLPADTPRELVAPPIEAPSIEAPPAQNRSAADPSVPTSIASALPQSRDSNLSAAEEFSLSPAKTGASDVPQALLQPAVSPPRMDSSALPDPGDLLSKASITHQPEPLRPATASTEIPEMYKLRVMPNRSEVTEQHGGSPETEKAVQAALKWLANNQAADGRWKASAHGAGRDENVQGHARQNAGSESDTGVTGLALLAFLAAGNTHEQGQYKENVRRGVEFLLRAQARDGNLGGSASVYEFMYCHAMGTCALSETFGMTRDNRLREPVTRAIRYSVAAQDPRGGGWRYRPGDTGDTSQLGWQLMALKSADLAGVPMSETTRRGIVRFLQSISSGKHGGLASYRAGEQVSRSMTAEALVCWQFLGLSRDHPACNEAGDFLLTELPGQGVKPNDYYWYYGTLAMYQLQGAYWQRWNEALQKTLLQRQLKEGPLAGAWDTDTVWGGYGGRIYTTAIATLSLEVYYRFLPLYSEGKTPPEQSK